MAVITNLTGVQSLIVSDTENRFGSAYKYLVKGFNNFHENGSTLKKLFLLQVYRSYAPTGIYKILKTFPDLVSIQCHGSNLSDEAC